MRPELHYFPATGKAKKPHIELWKEAAVDLTALTEIEMERNGLALGTNYEQKTIEEAAKALGISAKDVRAKLEHGEVVKW